VPRRSIRFASRRFYVLTTTDLSSDERPSLLFVVNYPADTGYAWDNIERSFARVADRLAERGVRTLVAYPKIGESPRTLTGSRAEAVELDATLQSVASLRATIEFVRRHAVRVLYLTDRPAWTWKYALLRRVGGCAIVVHDRTSGARDVPRGLRRAFKRAVVRTPGVLADVVVAVSDFVRDRQVEVGLVPEERVVRIHNGFAVEDGAASEAGEATGGTHAEFGIDPARPIVACASRASREKGVDTLLRAFDRVAAEFEGKGSGPVLIFLGDGPYLPELRKLRSTLAAAEDIVLGGYRPGAVALLHGASVFVVPSLWQDAFPSSVLEPMARGKPVVATAVGGIPEMIEPGVSGLLLPPGDVERMARAIGELLRDPSRAERIGREAKKQIRERFTPERQVSALVELFEARTGLLDPAPSDAVPG
jgi:glycosyltransferase involved in cell wall biosynthesis